MPLTQNSKTVISLSQVVSGAQAKRTDQKKVGKIVLEKRVVGDPETLEDGVKTYDHRDAQASSIREKGDVTITGKGLCTVSTRTGGRVIG